MLSFWVGSLKHLSCLLHDLSNDFVVLYICLFNLLSLLGFDRALLLKTSRCLYWLQPLWSVKCFQLLRWKGCNEFYFAHFRLPSLLSPRFLLILLLSFFLSAFECATSWYVYDSDWAQRAQPCFWSGCDCGHRLKLLFSLTSLVLLNNFQLLKHQADLFKVFKWVIECDHTAIVV